MARFKTPYDQDEAHRTYDRLLAQYARLFRQVASGTTEGGYSDPVYKKLIATRDHLDSLLRWVDAAHVAKRDLLVAPGEAYEAGVVARGVLRNAEMSGLRERQRTAESALSPELRQYRKELQLSAPLKTRMDRVLGRKA